MYSFLDIFYIIIFVILIFILLVFTYIRIKFGFWAVQPVFHIYDLWYYIKPPGIICHDLPQKNKYTNFKNIQTTVFSELSAIKFNKVIRFIQQHYLQNKQNKFTPLRENIEPYFIGHWTHSFFTIYTEPNILIDTKKGDTIEDDKIVSVITGRPLHVKINNGLPDANFDVYYVDYLCVDKNLRKKGIAPQMIQTHYYNECHINKNIRVCLFKREGELTGIVPLCTYYTYGFPVTKWTKPANLHSAFKILEINPQNYHFIHDFIKSNSNNFDIVITSDTANIIELIKTKNIFIYAIIVEDEIICAYFYRKTCVQVDKDMEVLSCFASINACDNSELFIQGFKISFWEIAEKNYFGFCAIECISHNKTIIDNIYIKTKPTITSPTAYFFYNFAYPTFKSDKVFVIN